MTDRPFWGTFPIVPTTFGEDGELDEASQRAVLDFLIAAGVQGVVVLANASEGFALSDAERDRVARLTIEHVAGRVPVVVTTSHYSSLLAARRSAEAERLGADAVMVLPPFYGGWAPDPDGVFAHFRAVAGAVGVPVVVQDHPVSGVAMPTQFLARLAGELPAVRYFKIETPNAPWKIAQLLRAAEGAVDGVFGGMNGATLMQELDLGACGTMPAASLPDVFARVCRLHREGRRAEAVALYDRHLPLIDFEARLAGRNTTKELLALGGVIALAHVREPGPVRLDETARAALLRLVEGLDLLALRHRTAGR